METKANYIATGAFTLAVIVGAFGFIFWFQNTGRSTAQATYRVVFDGSVSGLRTGAAVLFNGIRVGEVAELALDAADPHKVVAVIALGRTAPVRADTKVGLQFQGLTGLAEVSLAGGSVDAAPLTADAGTPPTLYADASATTDVTQQARDVLARIDGMVAANESALHLSLRNIETVTSTLADNSARLDKVMEGLQNLAGGTDGNGQIGRAADSIRRLADDLDKNTNEISAGLSQFSNSGLKEFQAFATDGRRTLAELNKAIKNIDQHPSRLIFGH
jgi:phospholipid/cholesterol/gamma-HCH transport system substrate-binding protein